MKKYKGYIIIFGSLLLSLTVIYFAGFFACRAHCELEGDILYIGTLGKIEIPFDKEKWQSVKSGEEKTYTRTYMLCDLLNKIIGKKRKDVHDLIGMESIYNINAYSQYYLKNHIKGIEGLDVNNAENFILDSYYVCPNDNIYPEASDRVVFAYNKSDSVFAGYVILIPFD